MGPFEKALLIMGLLGLLGSAFYLVYAAKQRTYAQGTMQLEQVR